MVYRSLFFLIIAAATVLVSSAPAQVPHTLSYQGLLTTALGTPVPGGTYKLQFDLFTDTTGGVSVWTETDSGISVQRGTFSLVLGSGTALPDSFHRPLYLQVTAISGPGISGPTLFAPRSGLSSAPYALSLRLPFTQRVKASPSAFTIINDSAGAWAIYGQSVSPGFSNIGAVNGVTTGFQANGIYGLATNGNGAWGVYGATDSGAGVAGYVFSQGGIGVAGYAGNDAKVGLGLYSFGKLRVDGPPGDTAVQLPDNSIASHEVLDMPGISQGIVASMGVTVTGATSAITIDSTTITIPAAGYIVVQAYSEAGLFNTTGVNQLCYGIDSLPPPAFDYNYYACAGLEGYPNTSFANYFPVAASRTFYRQPGTYTFWFKAIDGSSPSGNKYLWEPVTTAFYFPKAYGAVNTVVSPEEAAGFSTTAQRAPNIQQLQNAPTTPGSVVDLRELELKASKLREEAERAENELLKARLEKLKALEASKRTPE